MNDSQKLDSKRMILYEALAYHNNERKRCYAAYVNEIKKIKELEAALVELNKLQQGPSSFIKKQLRCSACGAFGVTGNRVKLTRNGPRCFNCDNKTNVGEAIRSLRDKAYDDIASDL